MRKLEDQPDMLNAYNEIVQSQKDEGIVERAPEVVRGTGHYIPHKTVIKENT